MKNNFQSSNTQDNDLTKELIEAFIGKLEKVDFYTNAFNKIATENKKWNWSWWAAFGNIGFLFHRRIFTLAIILTVVMLLLNIMQLIITLNLSFEVATIISSLSGLVGIAMFIFLGGYGIKMVFDRFEALKNEIMARNSTNEEKIKEMRLRGGFVDVWKIIAGYVIYYALILGLSTYLVNSQHDKLEVETMANLNQEIVVPQADTNSQFTMYYDEGQKIAKGIHTQILPMGWNMECVSENFVNSTYNDGQLTLPTIDITCKYESKFSGNGDLTYTLLMEGGKDGGPIVATIKNMSKKDLDLEEHMFVIMGDTVTDVIFDEGQLIAR